MKRSRPLDRDPELRPGNQSLPQPVEALGHHEGRMQYVAAGDVLYRKGEAVVAIYRIREGLIKLLTYLQNGAARIIRLQRSGSWLGLGGFLDRPYQHTAVAVTAVIVERFPMAELHGMREKEPSTLNRVLEQWYVDLEGADTWIAQFSTGSIRVRVAHLLRYLSGLDGGKQEMVQLLTVQEMGEILGVAPESVSRTIAAFKRSGLLRRVRGNRYGRTAYLIDVPRLQQELRRR